MTEKLNNTKVKLEQELAELKKFESILSCPYGIEGCNLHIICKNKTLVSAAFEEKIKIKSEELDSITGLIKCINNL